MNTEISLSLNNLTVDYPGYKGSGTTAVKDVSFSISKGKVLGLVGESGAGKTSIARAITRQLVEPGEITGGEIFFEDKDIVTMSQKDLKSYLGSQISLIVPNPKSELDPLLTIGRQLGDVVRTHLKLSKSETKQAVLDVLEAVQIPDHNSRFSAYPHELSGGMAQRVIIAMSLICNPKFVISDDATSGLDVTVQREIMKLMQKIIKEKNLSVLFITRDIGLAAHFCDHLGLLFRGQIVELAPINEFFKNPIHPYSLALLSAFSHSAKWRKVYSTDPEKWSKEFFKDGNVPNSLIEVDEGHLVRMEK
ncbi:MAG: Oligopeptide transport ATP-binding protein OppD [Alphaproteobacteria bacterium MarineAlpha2_Bin1]|nr:MAG: Oligopeptide transport ATP-binding protein OppD [Alphaproteobacteria bacterium MarineAlpha2_Bin1]